MAAPAWLGYAGTAAGDLHRVLGPLAASFALIAWWGATRAVRWPNVILAAALVLAPLAVDHDGAAGAIGVLAGVVLGAATPFAGAPSYRYGGGWAVAVKGPDRSDRRHWA